nr:helix-turn-helix transcriptional regulator [Bacteroidota bacterium]
MLSVRSKMEVKEELKKLGLHFVFVDMGEVEVMEDLTTAQIELLKDALLNIGLELMDDKKAILIDKIKNVVIELIHQTDESIKTNFSDYLSEKLNHNYTYMANLFSQVQGSTIEQYIIAHKIEKVKELIIYDELNLTEISYKLNYSSMAHLSNQFKKVTGLTPSQFKLLKSKSRIAIEDVGKIETPNNEIDNSEAL